MSRILVLITLIALGLRFAGPSYAQPPEVSTPVSLYSQARNYIFDGKYALAAEKLDEFLKANPRDQDFLQLEAEFGPTVFLELNNVVKWSENETINKNSLATVDNVLKKAAEVSNRLKSDQTRILRYIKQLTSIKEERLYAAQQLKLSGLAAVPPLVDTLRRSSDPKQITAIFAIIPELPAVTVPSFIAALEALPEGNKTLLLQAIVSRRDLLTLVNSVETDFTPYLWYYSWNSGGAATSLQTYCRSTLEELYGPIVTRKSPEEELTRLCQPLLERRSNFTTLGGLPNPGMVKVTTWNEAKLSLETLSASKSLAEEIFANRYLRWALTCNPNYEPAMLALTALTAERAIERSKFTSLLETEPEAYQLLASAPSELLAQLLQQGFAEKRTSLILGVLQSLSDRRYNDGSSQLTGAASTSPYTPSKPSLFTQGLDYQDPRVQLASAIALLRQPGTPVHGANARVVEILKRAIAADSDGSSIGKSGRVLIVDPSAARGERLAADFREIGYAAERFTLGRDLFPRLAKAADFDMIVIDRHTVQPQLKDLLNQVRADRNAVNCPVLVVASSDQPKSIPVEHLLLYMSNLVAALDNGYLNETITIKVPEPFAFDPNRPVADREEANRSNVIQRDRAIEALFELRFARLQRLFESADLPTTLPMQRFLTNRLVQFTWAGLVSQYRVNETNAPKSFLQLQKATRTVDSTKNSELLLQNLTDTQQLVRLIEKLESGLDDDQRSVFDKIRSGITAENLHLAPDTSRDAVVELEVSAIAQGLKNVSMLPDPYSTTFLKYDIEAAIQDPAQKPRDSAEMKASAKVAIEWFHRIATKEVTGYDIRSAEVAIRDAIDMDELAPTAIKTAAQFGSDMTQQALLTKALRSQNTVEIRLLAAESAILNIQLFGLLANTNQSAAFLDAAKVESSAELKGKLSVLAKLLDPKGSQFTDMLQGYRPKVSAMTAQPPMPPANPPAEEKN